MFLVIVTENLLSWNAYIDQLISKLCTACCAIRAIKTLMSQDTLKLEYYSYFLLWIMEKYSGEILHIVFMSSDYKRG